MPLKNYLPFVALLFSTLLSAQTDSIEQWRSLVSYRYGTYVTQSENSIIYTTGKALFYLDKEDQSISRIGRENGLAEARVRMLKYHQPTETLIIVYESGVIDLLQNNRFATLREIDNFNFIGDKRIYDVHLGRNNIVYFASGFGVTALSLEDNTFPFTTFTGVRVGGVAEYGGMLYAATDEGIYRVNRTGININDFGNWELMGSDFGLPGDYTSTAINVFGDELYFGVGLDVYKFDGQNLAELVYEKPADQQTADLQYLNPGFSVIMAGYRCTDRPCESRSVVYINEAGVQRISRSCAFRTRYAIEDENGRIWFAEDEDVRKIRTLNNASGSDCSELEFGGPRSDDNYRLIHDGSSLWVASSVLSETFTPRLTFTGAFRLKEDGWISYRAENIAAMRGQDGEIGGDDDLFSIVDVYYDKANDTHWFSSFFEGAVAFDAETETGEFFDESNSTLQNVVGGGSGRVRVAGVVADDQGFSYLANSRASEGDIISVRSPDGEWVALGGGCGINDAIAIEMDRQGYIWIVHATNIGGGITVLDTNGTPLDPSDDRCRTITANNSQLPSNNVRSVVNDLNGTVWVGTTQGVVLFECASEVFDAGTCTGRRPVAVDVDGNGFLLETEEINAITVDGANRKWIATNGGAYLLSADGNDQVRFFDKGNSPLLDDVVRDIAIDPNTGVVYFGTERGIISYRAEATSAAERTFREDLVVFPNPVEPGYRGPIAINGLARNARVKITDLSGKLVAEGLASGGQFVWEGTDYNGRRVTSGVYLVLASTNSSFGLESGNSAVGKIVFIR